MKKRLAGEITFIKFWRKRIKKISGTKEGGKKAAATNKLRNGEDFYARIGRIGGKVCGKKGFAMNPDLARRAGAIGGKLSKRGPNKK